MDNKINRLQMDKEFKICPACGYKDGFHSMFRRDKEMTRWLFICPSCHKIFDIGLTTDLRQDRQKTCPENNG